MKDLYAALGVPNFASADEIRTAYRRLASSLHPDRAGDRSTSAFQDIAAAYEVLGDPDRRAKYDAQRVRVAEHTTVSTSGAREPILRLCGPLRSLLAAGLLRTIGQDAYECWLSPHEAAQGGFITISTSAPNQLKHWFTVPPGITDGTVLPSLLKVGDIRSELRLRVRVE